MIVFVKCRRSESKCFFRSYVFADCGHEDKRKCKSSIVCLCGLQWLCLLSVRDLKVNVSSGRMSLRTAATKTKRKSKSNIVFLCGLQWLCLLSVGDPKVNVFSGRMSLRTAATKTKRKSKSNIVCLCGLQWLCLLSVGDLKVNVSSGCMSLRTAATKTKGKSKSNIVRLCGLQWLCLLSVGDMRVNVSSGRMSLRTASTQLRCVAIPTCWKKRFFKMGIVETCHTHKIYRHLFFWIIYFFPFETSATASCGYTGSIHCSKFCLHLCIPQREGILCHVDLSGLLEDLWRKFQGIHDAV